MGCNLDEDDDDDNNSDVVDDDDDDNDAYLELHETILQLRDIRECKVLPSPFSIECAIA
jgi:hypothetical protein